MRVTEPEFTRLATQVATALKAEGLRKQPEMDAEQVALFSAPTDGEVIAVKHTLRLVELAGYTIERPRD